MHGGEGIVLGIKGFDGSVNRPASWMLLEGFPKMIVVMVNVPWGEGKRKSVQFRIDELTQYIRSYDPAEEDGYREDIPRIGPGAWMEVGGSDDRQGPDGAPPRAQELLDGSLPMPAVRHANPILHNEEGRKPEEGAQRGLPTTKPPGAMKRKIDEGAERQKNKSNKVPKVSSTNTVKTHSSTPAVKCSHCRHATAITPYIGVCTACSKHTWCSLPGCTARSYKGRKDKEYVKKRYGLFVGCMHGSAPMVGKFALLIPICDEWNKYVETVGKVVNTRTATVENIPANWSVSDLEQWLPARADVAKIGPLVGGPFRQRCVVSWKKNVLQLTEDDWVETPEGLLHLNRGAPQKDGGYGFGTPEEILALALQMFEDVEEALGSLVQTQEEANMVEKMWTDASLEPARPSSPATATFGGGLSSCPTLQHASLPLLILPHPRHGPLVILLLLSRRPHSLRGATRRRRRHGELGVGCRYGEFFE